MQLASAEEEEGGAKGKAGGDNNEGLGTPDILNKLYQDIERDFQVGGRSIGSMRCWRGRLHPFVLPLPPSPLSPSTPHHTVAHDTKLNRTPRSWPARRQPTSWPPSPTTASTPPPPPLAPPRYEGGPRPVPILCLSATLNE